MSDYTVAMEAAWLVRNVDSVDDAIGIAVSEAGKRLNAAGIEYVEVDAGATPCPACGEHFDAAFTAAGTALVGLALEMTVFDAENTEHAQRIATSEIGDALDEVPLEVIHATESGDDAGEAAGSPDTATE